tara:strand:+ start:2796 stop:3938 length:1143 start_codon:yes stop_codon:yes gene_type:complete
MNKIQMVDLKGQYQKIKDEVNQSIDEVLDSTQFINGSIVEEFSHNLKKYLNVNHIIPCANGTDALQIALMSLDLKKGDEVICPAFTYVATAEVISLLGLKPILSDVDPDTFNITAEIISPLISNKTKAIIPVHLYGQSTDMEEIIDIANKHNLYIIEDNAQSIGSNYTFKNKTTKKTGTMGHIGTTSFFPSKNLGCYGDGGAIMTNIDDLAIKMKMIANHGQSKKYHHSVIGCNSRLDSIQAAILNIKLKYLDNYIEKRNLMAQYYDESFKDISKLSLPKRQYNSSHVFHQYTIKTDPKIRKILLNHLSEKGIPNMIYYPIPLYKQDAFSKFFDKNFNIPNVENLCKSVFSLPIHTEIENSSQKFIVKEILNFFKKNIDE